VSDAIKAIESTGGQSNGACEGRPICGLEQVSSVKYQDVNYGLGYRQA